MSVKRTESFQVNICVQWVLFKVRCTSFILFGRIWLPSIYISDKIKALASYQTWNKLMPVAMWSHHRLETTGHSQMAAPRWPLPKKYDFRGHQRSVSFHCSDHLFHFHNRFGKGAYHPTPSCFWQCVGSCQNSPAGARASSPRGTDHSSSVFSWQPHPGSLRQGQGTHATSIPALADQCLVHHYLSWTFPCVFLSGDVSRTRTHGKLPSPFPLDGGLEATALADAAIYSSVRGISLARNGPPASPSCQVVVTAGKCSIILLVFLRRRTFKLYRAYGFPQSSWQRYVYDDWWLCGTSYVHEFRLLTTNTNTKVLKGFLGRRSVF